MKKNIKGISNLGIEMSSTKKKGSHDDRGLKYNGIQYMNQEEINKETI